MTDIRTTSEVHKWERNQHIDALYTSHDQNSRLKSSKFEVTVRQREGIEVYEHSTNDPYLWARAAQYVLLFVHKYTVIFYLIFQSDPQSVHLPESGWHVQVHIFFHPQYSNEILTWILSSTDSLRRGCVLTPTPTNTHMYKYKIYTGLLEIIVGVLTTCNTLEIRVYVFFISRTTLQVFVTYLTGAPYVHALWFYKHQNENRVRSKLFAACQRWWFQWRLMFVESQRVHIQSTYKVCNKTWSVVLLNKKYIYS